MPRRRYTQYHKVMSEEERKQLLEYTLQESPSIRMSIWIMDSLGVRSCEALALRIQDIDFERKIVTINATKQNKVIEMPLPKSLALRLKTHYRQFQDIIEMKEGHLCFAHGHGAKGLHIKYKTLSWFFTRFRRKYGYTKPYNIRKDGKPQFRHASHTLRSCWGTRFLKACEKKGFTAHAPKLLQQYWQHADMKTTWKYIRLHDFETKVSSIIEEM